MLNDFNQPKGSTIGVLKDGRTIQQAFDWDENFVTLERFGFIKGSTADQTDAIQQAIYYAVANGLTLIGTPYAKGYTTKGIIIPPTLRADWRGFTIKTTTSGITAVTVASGESTIVLPYVAGTPLENLRVEGRFLAGTNATPDELFASDGIAFGASGSSQVSDLVIKGLGIAGFRDCAVFRGPSVYLLTFVGAKIGACWRRGVSWLASVDSGENIQFFGGSVYNCISSNLTAVGIYHSPESTGLEMNFNGTSFDYNDQDLFQIHSTFRFDKCHFENNNNRPKITVQNTSQRPASILSIRDSNIGGGPGASPLNSEREDSDGRPCFIDVVGANTSVLVTDCTTGKWMLGAQKTQVVRNSAGHAMRALKVTTVSDVGAATTQGWPLNPSFFLNRLHVVPNGSLTGWTQTVSSGVIFSSDTNVKAPHDSGSRKLLRPAEAGATSMSIYQDIPVNPGQSAIVKAWLQTQGIVSVGGQARLRVLFLNSSKDVTIEDNVQPRQVSADGVLTECAAVLYVPNGAAFMRVQSYATNIPIGTEAALYSSGERVWLS